MSIWYVLRNFCIDTRSYLFIEDVNYKGNLILILQYMYMYNVYMFVQFPWLDADIDAAMNILTDMKVWFSYT